MQQKGFTLIELLTVVLIIGILTAVAVPQYRKSLDRSRMAEAYSVMPAIRESIYRYATENNKNWIPLSSTNFNYPLWTGNISFNMLDVTLKGHQDENNSRKWITKNFEYTIFPPRDTYGVAYALGGNPVQAKFLRGRYKNLIIYYVSGKTFLCGSQTDSSAETRLANCDSLGLTTIEVAQQVPSLPAEEAER